MQFKCNSNAIPCWIRGVVFQKKYEEGDLYEFR